MVTTPKPVAWGDVIFKVVVVAAVGGGAALDWDTNVRTARTDATINGHISNHPNVGLSLRIDRMQIRFENRLDQQAAHIRELEREMRLERGQD